MKQYKLIDANDGRPKVEIEKELLAKTLQGYEIEYVVGNTLVLGRRMLITTSEVSCESNN